MGNLRLYMGTTTHFQDHRGQVREFRDINNVTTITREGDNLVLPNFGVYVPLTENLMALYMGHLDPHSTSSHRSTL